jgi:hypothetical protein
MAIGIVRRRRCGGRPDLAHDPADRLDSVLKPTLALWCVDDHDGDEHEGNPGNENDPGTHRILARRRCCGERPGLVGDPSGRLDSVLEPPATLGRVDEQDGTEQQGNPGNERDRRTHTQVIGVAEACPERLDGIPALRLRRQRWVERPDLVYEPADRLELVLKPALRGGRIQGQDNADQEEDRHYERAPGTHAQVIGSAATDPEIPSRLDWEQSA